MKYATYFEFASPGSVVFSRGKLAITGIAAAEMGKKAFIVAGFQGEGLDRLTDLLSANQVAYNIYPVKGEPDIEVVELGRNLFRQTGCDLVIAIGGGSAIDTGKAIAILLTNPDDILDYLEVIGNNQPILQPPVPFIAIPTTAGTGSEVTRNAVISVPEKAVKVSLRSPMMIPRLAVIDPELTVSLPPVVTASTGMDALTQVIEPFVSIRANAFVDLFCLEGIKRGSRALSRAFQSGYDIEAREDMSFTSLMGGYALANAGLGAVHGFAGVIGGMFAAPHGSICASLLSSVVLMNSLALSSREPNNPAIIKYQKVAQIVIGRKNATISELCSWLENLRFSLKIPSLSKYGIQPEHLDLIVEKSTGASSMKANPLVLSTEELKKILELAL